MHRGSELRSRSHLTRHRLVISQACKQRRREELPSNARWGSLSSRHAKSPHEYLRSESMHARISALLLAFVLACTALASAQGTTGTISGRIVDSQGLAV